MINRICLTVKVVWALLLAYKFTTEKDKFKRIEWLVWFGIAVCV
jgi:hypothetical protein